MRICFVSPEFVTEPTCFDGGLANYLFRVSLGLIELGHIPIIIVSSDISEIISYKDIEVHRVNVKPLSGSSSINWLYQSYILNNYLEEIVSSKEINIVQYASYTGVGFYRIQSIPAVVRISSYNPLLSKYYNWPDEKSTRDDSYIEISAIKNADALFGPSLLIANEICQNENLKIKIIESPFVFDVVNFDLSLSDQLLSKKYLLFFGTVGLLKGVKTIAETLNDLFSKYSDLFFVFIGKDAGFNGNKMMDYVYDHAGHYCNRIYYYNKMEHEKLYPFINNAYAIILPSRIDNFPNTCIEAMAFGKIVIGTENTGFDQLIEDEVNGFLCQKDNPDDLLQTIEKVLFLSEHDIRNIQDEAIKRIDLLKPHCVVRELINFYEDIIKYFEKNKTLLNESNKKDSLIIWDHILEMENKFEKQSQIICSQSELSKSIYNSKRYKIGDFILQPISFFLKHLNAKN